MSAHTPGDWKYYEDNNYGGTVELGASNVTVTVDRADRFTSALVISREEMNANGRLVAAAPDLLAENQRLRERVAELVEAFKREVPAEQKPYFYETADASRDAGERARCDRINAQRTRMLAAIAKAEGER